MYRNPIRRALQVAVEAIANEPTAYDEHTIAAVREAAARFEVSEFYRDMLPEAPTYEWHCFGTITCDPLLDAHGRECERMNDEARSEFWADVVRSTPIGDLL